MSSDNIDARRASDVDQTMASIPAFASTSDVTMLMNGADMAGDGHGNKSGRVKACADCRKSKVSHPL